MRFSRWDFMIAWLAQQGGNSFVPRYIEIKVLAWPRLGRNRP